MSLSEIDLFAKELFDPDLCRQCGGLCCQGHPGIYADPSRFLKSFFPDGMPSGAQQVEALALIGIDLKNFSGIDIPAPRLAPWGCVFWGREGCRLSAEDRPCECLILQPCLETLLEGEIHCKPREGFRYTDVRERWQRFWDGLI